jgi:hypothetical protein
MRSTHSSTMAIYLTIKVFGHVSNTSVVLSNSTVGLIVRRSPLRKRITFRGVAIQPTNNERIVRRTRTVLCFGTRVGRTDIRYIANKDTFKCYAYTALQSRFGDRAQFERFYASLCPDSTTNEFLRVASSYLFLVKQGEWHVNVAGADQVVDYLSNSFKLVALFSLIESLSEKKHQDFYGWLSTEVPERAFPIADKRILETLNENYKGDYGSIRRCVSFFERLPSRQKEALSHAIKINGKPLASIKKVAQFLYDLRSKFVHEGRFVLQVNGENVLSMKDKKMVQTQLLLETLLEAFEQGVMLYFETWIAATRAPAKPCS